MIQHTALQRDDTMTAKDNLLLAARQASPSKYVSGVVRRNPWASVLTAGASTLVITGVIGSFRIGGRAKGGGALGGLAGLVTAAGGLISPLSGVALKAVEAYVMKKTVTATEPAQAEEHAEYNAAPNNAS